VEPQVAHRRHRQAVALVSAAGPILRSGWVAPQETMAVAYRRCRSFVLLDVGRGSPLHRIGP
jgi:hypothetical protein